MDWVWMYSETMAQLSSSQADNGLSSGLALIANRPGATSLMEWERICDILTRAWFCILQFGHLAVLCSYQQGWERGQMILIRNCNMHPPMSCNMTWDDNTERGFSRAAQLWSHQRQRRMTCWVLSKQHVHNRWNHLPPQRHSQSELEIPRWKRLNMPLTMIVTNEEGHYWMSS